jgi:class 3 adenylate cyclase/CHASE2 domain-containing sensor protein
MKRSRLLVVPGIAAASALLAQGLMHGPLSGRLLTPVEETTLDWRALNRETHDREHSRVALVLFDTAAVRDWDYLMPFPRAHLADVIDAVAAAHPRAIGLDVYLDRRYPRLNERDHGDERLREAIRRAGNVVLATGTEATPRGRRVMPVDPYFAEVAAGVGTADLPTPFETVRDGTVTVRAGGRRVPSLALALYSMARGLAPDSLARAAERTGAVAVPGMPGEYARVPRKAEAQTFPILFVGPPSRTGDDEQAAAFSQLSAFNAFSSSTIAALGALTPAAFFQDKVVLIGSGFHEQERFRSPFYAKADRAGHVAGWTYGVEVHANALEDMLTGQFPRPLSPALAWLVLLAAAGVVTLLTFRGGIAWGAVVGPVLAAAYTFAAFWAFTTSAIALPVVAPALAMVVAFLGSTSYISVVEGRDRREIRRAFAKYVPPGVISALEADPASLKLGGEKRHVTILFTDLAGFTSLSETLDPHEVLVLLNRYLDAMATLVLEEGGTLDKYIGDAVMALYGAPTSVEDHALRACRTALRMQARLAEMNAAGAHGWGALRMRVGINSGTPVVGNIGGRERFDYTALGDAVNLAARLEPACKTYEVGVMISGATRALVGDAVVARELEVLAVYGKAEPVPVYELVALAGEDLGPRAEVLEHYEKGLAAYRGRDFEMALVYFSAALECDPGDGPSLLYAERCRTLLQSPPPEEWSFVERRQIK